MTWFRSMVERLKALVGRGRMDAEMEDELRFHLEMETNKNLAKGMPPAEAHRQAMISFGGVDRFGERTREERGVRPIEELVRAAVAGLDPHTAPNAVQAVTVAMANPPRTLPKNL